MTDLSIIIVSWNVRDFLKGCLDSLLQSPLNRCTMEIIVVDSGSTDASAEFVRSHYPQVKLLPQEQNLGFTHCNNIGLETASGRHMLLLNPDTEVIGNALVQMVAYLDSHPKVGIIGPHTLNSDRTTQSTRRRFPTLAVGFLESTWMQSYAPPSIMNYYYVNDADDTATLEVDWVQGSALMVRRDVYAQIGGLDEGYVMYSEELDWCKRAKQAGWQVVYLGSAEIMHYGGKSSEQVTANKHIYFQQSKLRYFRKYHGWFVAQILRAFLLMNYIWQIGLESTKSLLGHKRALRQERIHAYWQVLRSGLKVS